MFLYLIYLFVGGWAWAAQLVAVAALLATSRFAQRAAWYAGRSGANWALGLAALFAVLMVPVALMIVLRRHNAEFPTSFTDPPGIACMVQLALLATTAVNAGVRWAPSGP
jgi:hypothetical protein